MPSFRDCGRALFSATADGHAADSQPWGRHGIQRIRDCGCLGVLPDDPIGNHQVGASNTQLMLSLGVIQVPGTWNPLVRHPCGPQNSFLGIGTPKIEFLAPQNLVGFRAENPKLQSVKSDNFEQQVVFV